MRNNGRGQVELSSLFITFSTGLPDTGHFQNEGGFKSDLSIERSILRENYLSRNHMS